LGFGFPSLSASGIASVAHNTGAGLYAEDEVRVDVSSGSFGSNVGLVSIWRRAASTRTMRSTPTTDRINF
jgi:hypothetical protein